MTKSPHAFRSIGEVARLVGVATHVLRYWETQFPALAPVTRADGRRYYRLDDVLLTAGICEVLREEGLTIRGARRLIAQDKGAGLRARGRLRLGDRLGLDEPAPPVTDAAVTALDAAAMPVAPALASPPGTAATRSDSVSAPRRQGRAPVAIETLPLFPELETSPQPAAPFVIDGAADGAATADWLARLCATAAGLRLRETPLPDHASDLAAALRAARAALDHGVPA